MFIEIQNTLIRVNDIHLVNYDTEERKITIYLDSTLKNYWFRYNDNSEAKKDFKKLEGILCKDLEKGLRNVNEKEKLQNE